MGFGGNQFTWKRGREERFFVAKRLDRILCCAHTRLKWQEATVTHLPFFSSDHSAMYLQLAPKVNGNAGRRPFRFEAAWLSHPSFKELLVASWDAHIDTRRALGKLEVVLRKWNREVFGDVQRRKESLVREIKEVQDELEHRQSDALIQREAELVQEFDIVLEQEETIWFQKSREKWVAHGDRNTTFFHASTIVRRRRNRIEMLKNEEGIWLSSTPELEKLAIDYFQRLYSMDDVDEVVEALPMDGFTELNNEDIRGLEKTFTEEEIVTAVRSMGRFKAPGPDGYQPVFYQQCWMEVGDSVTRFVLEFFRTGELPQDTNDAIVVLLAKVASPEKIQQFRPISLCNVLFKIITKTMVGRMKRVMTKLIGPAQSSFIPGRLSTDNVVIVQEAVHSMRQKKGKKGWMLLKLDLEKAYDRIRWDFLENTLHAANLPEKWVKWIMQCVSGPSMSLLWNGEKTESFKPLRGLRQGDPLSPYLFVMCMERLCHLIERSIDEKEWKRISLSRGGPKLSHICFADDLILFAEASVGQIRVIRRVLEKFCKASGQKVSLDKSKIFFSENVSRELCSAISAESGIQATRELGRYLGMPILQKRINKETFGSVLERVSSKLASWKGRMLSLAGRITLTKAVISSVPVHTMSSIKLPESMVKSLDRVSRDFVWGSTLEKRKQHLVGWDRICLPKSEGGLGIRKSGAMNMALVAKVGWRVLHDTTSLWARVLRGKYKIGDIRDARWTEVKGTWSSTWRSIAAGIRLVIKPAHGWVVGDGRDIRFWTDRWLLGEPLIDSVIAEVPEVFKNMTLRDLWIDGTGWDLLRIAPFVTLEKRLEMSVVVVNTITGRRDRLSWPETSDDRFTVASVYRFLTRDGSFKPDMDLFFKKIWRVSAPERIRVFLWLVGNQEIMTNKERFRRHIGDTEICQVCKSGVESIIHVLRDCPAMQGIWRRIVPHANLQTFFDMSLFEWLFVNMSNDIEVAGRVWSTMFSVGVWWAWKWRCGNVFGETMLWRDKVKFVKDYATEVQRSMVASSTTGAVNREERMISWMPPLVGWTKLNTDGASHGNPRSATAGGVLRDGEAKWCGGFALNIGRCTAPMAELWGLYYGLCIAWEKVIERLNVEVDSSMVVGFMKTGISDTHPLSFLVHLCQGLLSKDWEVRISYVYREANRLADGLANYAFSLSLGLHTFDVVPPDLLSVIREDEFGLSHSRYVRV
ncbi:unnamed protein product [Microthlaspi erraticum]|uniref:Reverse transcriptase domain-containing protein n=1 Tax=Microthlaspi erraticum TaxID=1685480 RepID=A0A6D2J4D1_9BRAS|nr:unnamed protein product [Microthlaspi erraticum]